MALLHIASLAFVLKLVSQKPRWHLTVNLFVQVLDMTCECDVLACMLFCHIYVN